MQSTISSVGHRLIDIGTHSLALYTHGPEPPSSSDPVVLFIPGVASSSLNWAAVVRALSGSLRSYTYDRSGYRNSESSPHEPSAENIALELSLLIEKAPIPNPLILVGHSWAGVLINEFIALNHNSKTPKQIAGMVLVDANHETSPEVLDINNSNLLAMADGLNLYTALGLESEHKMTPQEWDEFLKDVSTEKYKLIAAKEDGEQYDPSFEKLRRKSLHSGRKQPLLADKPVYVIGGMRSRDWSRLYEAGVARGNGTEDQRRFVRDWIRTADERNESLMRRHLELSTRHRLVFARESGHFVQLTQPDIVVEGIHWVLKSLGDPSSPRSPNRESI